MNPFSNKRVSKKVGNADGTITYEYLPEQYPLSEEPIDYNRFEGQYTFSDEPIDYARERFLYVPEPIDYNPITMSLSFK